MLPTLIFCHTLLSLGQDPASLRQAAILQAVDRVAPGVVGIETSGGTDVVGQPAAGGRPAPGVRRGTGPTTGLVVAADGWIISSAFNLANQPASVVVTVGNRRFLAKIIATDSSRMLTLLKIEATGLKVPDAVPRDEIRVGMAALALGRTLAATSDAPPSVSEGIVSALGRIGGKAIQTDAKVSPVNYGGPLVSLDGRVMGVLVPASPESEGATAGFEWYDSGIGFAVPLEDLRRVLPTLQKGVSLARGVLGVTLSPGDPFRATPKLATVRSGSAADKGGLRVGDIVTAVDGKPVTTQGQFQRQLGPRYQGEKIKLSYLRDGKEAESPLVELLAPETGKALAMLGITPLRDTTGQGVVIRSVIEGGPAHKAGLKAGDRLVGLLREQGPPIPAPIADRAALAGLIESADAGQVLKLLVRRAGTDEKPKDEKPKDEKPKDEKPKDEKPKDEKPKDEKPKDEKPKDEKPKDEKPKGPETVSVTLVARPPDLLAKPREPGSAKEGTPPPATEAGDKDPAEKPRGFEPGLAQKTIPSGDGKYWMLVPANYRADIAHGVLIWLHPANRSKEPELRALLEAWAEAAAARHLILLAPVCPVETGWTPSDADMLREMITQVAGSLTVDRRRVVAHGVDQGAQMALHMGLVAKDWLPGVAVLNAGWNGAVRDRVAGKPVSFFLVVADRAPSRLAVQDLFNRVYQRHYPAISRINQGSASSYLDAAQIAELAAWIDSLDAL